jgi:hypothetical protein
VCASEDVGGRRGGCPGVESGVATRRLFEPELLDLGLGELVEAVQQPVGEMGAALRIEGESLAHEFVDRHAYHLAA